MFIITPVEEILHKFSVNCCKKKYNCLHIYSSLSLYSCMYNPGYIFYSPFFIT